MTITAPTDLAERARPYPWMLGAVVGLLLIFGVQWTWGLPLTNDGPAHLFSAFVFNHHGDSALGYAEHFDLRNPITGNGWRLIAWLEPWVGWKLAYRLWYLLAASLTFLSAWNLWRSLDRTAGDARSKATPWLAVTLSLPLAFQMGLYLGTLAYLLGVAFGLFGLAALLTANRSRDFVWIAALWFTSAWFHPVPIAFVGLLGGLVVLSGEKWRARLGALALASVPALVVLGFYLHDGLEPHDLPDNRFAPVAERTVLLLSRLLPAPSFACVLWLVISVVGLGYALRPPHGGARGMALGAAGLLIASMLLPEHAFGWQLVSGRLLPIATPIALASLVLAPERIRRFALACGSVLAAFALAETLARHLALRAAAEEALAGIDDAQPAPMRLVELITRPFGTDAQDLDLLPADMEPMGKLSSIWAIRTGGRPIFTFANPGFAVHPLKLRPTEPNAPFPVHDADQVRDAWPERGDDLRRFASSAAGVGGLFAFGEPGDARVYDEAGFVRVAGRGAVYVGRFEGCRGHVRLSAAEPGEVEVSVGWWPRRTPQWKPSLTAVGPVETEIDSGLLGCGEVWVAVTPGRCAEGTPSRARFSPGQDNVLSCTVVNLP